MINMFLSVNQRVNSHSNHSLIMGAEGKRNTVKSTIEEDAVKAVWKIRFGRGIHRQGEPGGDRGGEGAVRP